MRISKYFDKWTIWITRKNDFFLWKRKYKLYFSIRCWYISLIPLWRHWRRFQFDPHKITAMAEHKPTLYNEGRASLCLSLSLRTTTEEDKSHWNVNGSYYVFEIKREPFWTFLFFLHFSVFYVLRIKSVLYFNICKHHKRVKK